MRSSAPNINECKTFLRPLEFSLSLSFFDFFSLFSRYGTQYIENKNRHRYGEMMQLRSGSVLLLSASKGTQLQGSQKEVKFNKVAICPGGGLNDMRNLGQTR
jgi:hypothetical protein